MTKIKLLFMCMAIMAFLFFPQLVVYGNSVEKEWTTLDDVKVYGYWKEIDGNTIFIECDPDTGNETGYAFINKGHYEEKEKKIVETYEYVKKEDFTRVTQLRPVTVNTVFAPNIPTGMRWDREYYEQTGESRNTTSSHVSWPGNRMPKIVPGSNPGYWLIVAEVSNPNPFPVKANVEVKLFGAKPPVRFEEELSFEAQETKYIKLNEGPLEEIMQAEPEEDDDGDWDNGWSSIWASTKITENGDPNAPEYMKPVFGWVDSWWGFDLDLSDPEVLNSNMQYRFEMGRHTRAIGYGYFMKGYVKYTEDGWKVTIREMSKPEYTGEAVKTLLDWINANAPNLPYLEDDDESLVIKGERGWTNTYTYLREFCSYDALLSNSCATWKWDQLGPVVVGYKKNDDLRHYEMARDDRPSPRLKDPSIVGWHKDKLPIIEKEYIFIPWYEFVATEGDNIGYLKKTMKPGYYLDDDDISVPKFELTTSFVDWNKKILNNGKTRFEFTFDIKLDAVNQSNHDCRFTANYGTLRFYMPKVRFLKNFIQYHNSITVDKNTRRDGRYRKKITTYTSFDEPEIVTPEFDIIDLNRKSIVIPGKCVNTVYSERRTIAFDITLRTDYSLDTPTFKKFLNDNREAAFSGRRFTFEIIPDDTIMGLAKSDMRYKEYEWYDDEFDDYRKSDYGSPYGIPVISALHKGMPVLPNSELYTTLLKDRKRFTIPFPQSSYYSRYYIHSDFWPVATEYKPHESPGLYPKYLNLYARDEFFEKYLGVGVEKDVDYR